MNRKETTRSLAIVSMALLATIMTATTSTQALAIDYGSPDLNYQPSGGFVGDRQIPLVLPITLTKNLLTKNKKIAQLLNYRRGRRIRRCSNDKEDSSGLAL